MDIEINTFDGIKLKTANTYVEEDINLSVSDKAFEEILYNGEVENGTLGANRLAGYFNGSITEITKEDLAGVTQIRNTAFYNAPITSVDIPNTVTNIGDNAFAYCKSLTKVTIPDSVTSIGDSAFNTCKSLTNITIPNSVTKLGTQSFAECTSLISITIPDSITSINSSAFSGCTSLTSATISKNLKTVSNSLFIRCTNLTSITIPASVTRVENGALKIGSTENKATITFLGTTPPNIHSGAFDKSYIEKIIVPKGYGEVYKSATNFSNFADYIEEATE